MLILFYHHILPLLVKSNESRVPAGYSNRKVGIILGVILRFAEKRGIYNIGLHKEAAERNESSYKRNKRFKSVFTAN